MHNNGIPKSVPDNQIQAVKKRGQPKKQWQKDVTKNLRQLSVWNWTGLVMVRRFWGWIVSKAKAHKNVIANIPGLEV